ncbi:MAG: site-specific integrase [Pseudomonadales bacterium]|nr:site-specific integrase [Pseudomonadales bacterium]
MAKPEPYTTETGKKRFRIRKSIDGAPIQKGGFKTATEARQWLKDQERKLQAGHTSATNIKVGKLIDDYMKRDFLSLAESTQRSRKAELEYWKERIGTRRARDITPAVIVTLTEDVKKLPGRGGKGTLSNSSVRKFYMALRAVFTAAYKRWHVLDANPFLATEAPPDAKGRDVLLTENELIRLFVEIDKSQSRYLKPFIGIVIVTGARFSEVQKLRWENVDFERCRVSFMDTKNGTHRSALITERVLGMLSDLQKGRNGQDYVFVSPSTGKPLNVRKAWETARAKAGVSHFRIHDIRHQVGTLLASNGASLRQLADQLGHKDLKMVMRYSHLTAESVGAGANLIEQNIKALAAPTDE